MWSTAALVLVALWVYWMTITACLGFALGGPRVTLRQIVGVLAWRRRRTRSLPLDWSGHAS